MFRWETYCHVDNGKCHDCLFNNDLPLKKCVQYNSELTCVDTIPRIDNDRPVIFIFSDSQSCTAKTNPRDVYDNLPHSCFRGMHAIFTSLFHSCSSFSIDQEVWQTLYCNNGVAYTAICNDRDCNDCTTAQPVPNGCDIQGSPRYTTCGYNPKTSEMKWSLE